MSPRTHISATNGLRVSKPGVSVLTATEQQLAFDSAKATPWLYYKGSFTVGASSGFFVTYGETLAALPICVVTHPHDSGGRIQMGTGAFTLNSGPPPYFDVHYQIVVELDRFTVLNRTASSRAFAVSLYRII